MKKLIMPAAMALAAATLLAAEPSSPSPASSDVAGKWKSEFDTRVGHLKYTYELKNKGDKLTGTALREREGVKTETELKDITLKGDQLSFVEPIKIQDQDVNIEYTGKVSGNEIKLTRKVGDFATTEIVARRDTEAPASVTGKWKTEFDSQIGKQTYTYELKAEGEHLTGKAIGESQFGKFDTAITEGKISPSGIAFVEQLKLPDREIRIEYTGKLEGQDLKLTRKVGDIATEEIVAKRVQPASDK